MSEKSERGSAMFPEIEDPNVSNEQLGAIVRAYRGVTRPPQVIVVRPSWFEVMLVLACLSLAGVVAVGSAILYRATLTNRGLGSDIITLVCHTHTDPNDVTLDEHIRKICEEQR